MATTLEPPRVSDPPPDEADGLPRIPARAEALRDAGYGKAVWWGIAASLVFHLFLIFFVSRLLEIGALAWDQAFPRSGPIPDALEVIDVREVPDLPSLIVPLPPSVNPARRPPAETPVGVTVPPADGQRRLTNAQRLQPRPGDLRLWRDFRGRAFGDWRLTGFARGDSALLAAIDRLYDSLGLNDLERRTLDWLLETEGGKKWGITPEAIYLGTITLPNIFSALFEPTGPMGRELAQQAIDRGLIDQQDIRTHWEETVKERQKAIRERSKEELERRLREEESDGQVRPDSVTS